MRRWTPLDRRTNLHNRPVEGASGRGAYLTEEGVSIPTLAFAFGVATLAAAAIALRRFFRIGSHSSGRIDAGTVSETFFAPCALKLGHDSADGMIVPIGTRVPKAAGSVEDFDIAQSKIGESAQRIVDRAVEASRRRGHVLLTNEHIFLGFAQVEWDTFAQVMRDLGLNPHDILRLLEEHVHALPTSSEREL